MATVSPPIGTAVVVTGWGDLFAGGSSPSQLQQVEVNIVDHEECRKNNTETARVTDRMICAGVPEEGKGPCHGDSGGPLVSNGTLVGVVSWGFECAREGYPGVYSDVAKLRPWVQSTTKIV